MVKALKSQSLKIQKGTKGKSMISAPPPPKKKIKNNKHLQHQQNKYPCSRYFASK